MYCRLAQLIGNRKELSEESLEGLEEVVMDNAKAQAILEASRSSMGEPNVFVLRLDLNRIMPLFCPPWTNNCPWCLTQGGRVALS